MSKIYRKWWKKEAGFTDEMCAKANKVLGTQYRLQRDFSSYEKALEARIALDELMELTKP